MKREDMGRAVLHPDRPVGNPRIEKIFTPQRKFPESRFNQAGKAFEGASGWIRCSRGARSHPQSPLWAPIRRALPRLRPPTCPRGVQIRPGAIRPCCTRCPACAAAAATSHPHTDLPSPGDPKSVAGFHPRMLGCFHAPDNRPLFGYGGSDDRRCPGRRGRRKWAPRLTWLWHTAPLAAVFRSRGRFGWRTAGAGTSPETYNGKLGFPIPDQKKASSRSRCSSTCETAKSGPQRASCGSAAIWCRG